MPHLLPAIYITFSGEPVCCVFQGDENAGRPRLGPLRAGPDIGPLQGELNRVLFLALPFLTLLFLAGDGVRREFFLRAIGSPR